ncbi:MAG TPA: PIN domain-containing protein [Planctomycetaceae bacterium]|nr:PIN domain-containing protein [Planctomycetaceae bacterium]
MAIEEAVPVDTGPLIAYMNRDDAEHESWVEVFDDLPLGKAFTCWPVLTEAAYLMRARLGLSDPAPLLDLILNDELAVLPVDRRDVTAVQDVFRRFHDQQVDLADAMLLALAEREDISTIFTTDRRDFRIFRRLDGTPLRLLPDDYR